jgi:structural maintenance of chromosome 2
VHQALSLVGYPQEVANAMSYVFSDNLICTDADSAKRVTFSSEVGVRSVTLEGDVYDPSGSLTGGAAPSGSGILIKAQELMEVGGRLEAARKTLDGLEKEGERKKQGREEWRRLKRELEMKEHEGRLMEEQVGDSNAARVGLIVRFHCGWLKVVAFC